MPHLLRKGRMGPATENLQLLTAWHELAFLGTRVVGLGRGARRRRRRRRRRGEECVKRWGGSEEGGGAERGYGTRRIYNRRRAGEAGEPCGCGKGEKDRRRTRVNVRTLVRSHKNFLLESCSALFSSSVLAFLSASAAAAGPRKGRRGVRGGEGEEAEQGRCCWSPLLPNVEMPTTPRAKAGWRRR